jgi:hypothetical protein
LSSYLGNNWRWPCKGNQHKCSHKTNLILSADRQSFFSRRLLPQHINRFDAFSVPLREKQEWRRQVSPIQLFLTSGIFLLPESYLARWAALQ